MTKGTQRKSCPHEHGEYSDDYRHCRDCGMEWVRINREWFPVEMWVRLSTKFIDDISQNETKVGDSR